MRRRAGQLSLRFRSGVRLFSMSRPLVSTAAICLWGTASPLFAQAPQNPTAKDSATTQSLPAAKSAEAPVTPAASATPPAETQVPGATAAPATASAPNPTSAPSPTSAPNPAQTPNAAAVSTPAQTPAPTQTPEQAAATQAPTAAAPPAAEATPEPGIDKRPIEVSIIVGGHFFSSTAAIGRSDYAAPGSELRHSVALGARIGYGLSRHFLLEGEFVAMPTQLVDKPAQVLVYTGRAHLLFRWPFGKNDRFQPFILAGGGAIGVRPDPGLPLHSEVLGSFHAGAGMRFDLNRWVGLRVDGRIVLLPETKTPSFTQDYEVLGSLYGRFGYGSDKPAEPAKPLDIDQDGVPDKEDRCPTEKGAIENGGCPDRDTDSDGVIDRLDKCPAQAGPSENGGCPDTDSDSDGVVDRLDKCPNEIGPQVNAGCPDTDSDSDGIVDRLDKCPQQPETVNNYQDQDGCPDELPANLARFVDKKLEGVQFLPTKADLVPSSFAVLDQAVAALKEVPSVRLEVQGHTDNVGNPNDNLTLSQQRADSVKAYLIGKGVDPARLTAVGYGSTQPVADNKLPAGRAQNRRVEFKLLPPARPTVIRKPQPAPITPIAPAPQSVTAPATPAKAPVIPPAATNPATQAPSVVPVAPPPVVPKSPAAPAIPAAPKAPVPATPAAPAVPTVPATPAVPTAPAVPTPPAAPAVPTPPAAPAAPAVPTAPAAPTVPTAPAAPTPPAVPAPVAPASPKPPVEPVLVPPPPPQ